MFAMSCTNITPFCEKKTKFTPHKAEQPLKSMELHEQQEEKDEKHIGKLFRKNPKIKGVYYL